MSNKQTSSTRSGLGAVLAGIVLVLAIFVSAITGVDIEELLGIEPTVTLTQAPPTSVADLPGEVATIPVQQGYGAAKDFWQVFFTAPTGSRDPADYVGGIDNPLAAAINGVQRTLDIAAFEWNNPLLTEAVLAAHERGVQVRVVTDDEHGLEDDDSLIEELIDAGIPVVDDARSGLMHNKFMIMDGLTVWTGSMNFTVNGAYRNNNNLIALRSRRAVETYQSEFDEMFVDGEFGIRSPVENTGAFNQDGIPVGIYFASENGVLNVILNQVEQAQESIEFMAFSFTVDPIADMIEQRAAAGVEVRGIFETLGSETEFSELRPLFCAGLPVRQDGNPFILHHKVFIIDGRTVLTGSFNFSDNATRTNDENLLVITDPALAAQYLAEFERRWAEAAPPDDMNCS